MRKFLVLGGMAVLLLGTAPALADEWAVVKLRGTVQQLIDGAWTPVARGDKIADDRPVRTLGDGHADLQRGAEIVTLGADTQVVIHDKADVRYTTVQQDFGTVEVEAQVENVQHFAVETKFLAAVVKGTHFTVTASDLGASVAVERGQVEVESAASKRKTTVTIGQMASVAPATDMVVSGDGSMPAIFGPDGRIVQPAGAPAASPPAIRTNSRKGPLSGVRVLDFAWALVGSISTKTLGDLGAEVVKVESRTRPDLARLDVQVSASQPGNFDDKPWFAHIPTATAKRAGQHDRRGFRCLARPARRQAGCRPDPADCGCGGLDPNVADRPQPARSRRNRPDRVCPGGYPDCRAAV